MNSIKNFTTEYELYLQDESRKKGFADSISFPKDIDEVVEIVKYCHENNIQITVQGSRTGVGSGAVPFGGHVMSLEKLRTLKLSDDGKSVISGAGCSLKEINEFIKKNTANRYFFPLDPTESTASAGGMVSCNSSGARTYLYGSVRNYVKRLKLVMADGEIFDITRGTVFAEGRSAELKINTFNTGGDRVAVGGADDEPPEKIIHFELPDYKMPCIKNAAGYYIDDDMDLIEIFIGAEGTLGIITEVEFKIIEKPKLIWGVISYFKDDERGIAFAEELKQQNYSYVKNTQQINDIGGVNDTQQVNKHISDMIYVGNNIMSIEFFDVGSLMLLREKGFDIPNDFREAVFTELKAESKEEMLQNIRLIETCITKVGGVPDDAWVAGSSRSFETFKEMRHATPEAVNGKIAAIKKQLPEITKLGSDMSVPDEHFNDIVSMYKMDLESAGLDYVMFGHIGNNHLHVNIISHSEAEYLKGKSIFGKWAEEIRKKKGSVSAEHGIGKLKRDFLIKMYGEKAVGQMRNMKKSLDPSGILGRDNIFIWNWNEK